MAIDLKPTQRGFLRGDFVDDNGDKCSIQESAVDHNLWLGCDHETMNAQGNACGARMHLTRELAADLIPLLQRFVDTGELS